MRKLIGLILILSSSVTLFELVVSAHDNDVIHPYVLTSKARDLLLGRYTRGEYDELKNYFEPIPSDFNNLPSNPRQGTSGTIEEDNPVTRCVNHFYNPLFPDRRFTFIFWTGEPAIKYGIPIWQEAIDKYGNGDKNGAYHSLGRAIHLLEDMSGVPHVYQDSHAYEWAQEQMKLGGNDEAWVRDNHSLISYDDYGIRQPATLSYEKFLDEMARKTYFGARIQGHLHEIEELPATGYLAKLFPPMPYGYKGALKEVRITQEGKEIYGACS